MAYIPLQDLVIKIDGTSKDINIIQYNQTMSKLQTYINQMNNNVEELGNFKETIGTQLPQDGEDGDEFVVLE